MKTINLFFIATAIMLICFSTNALMAQEQEQKQEQKQKLSIPAKGNFIAELNFKPFGENIISFNQLQLKYRFANNWAVRLGLAFNSNALNQPDDDYDPSQEMKPTGKEKSTKFGVLPGVEFHFLKNSKISPYVGAEFSFFNRSVKSHYRDYTYTDYYNPATGYYETRYIPVEIDINGATRSISYSYIQTPQGYYSYLTTEYLNRAYSAYGGNLLFGCDFYIIRHLYIGLELGVGYNYTKYKKVTIDISNQVKPTILPSYAESKLGFYYNSALRLGVWF